MNNVRHLTWRSMILDPSPEVRAEGYSRVPLDLEDARPDLERAMSGRDGVGDDAVTFLVGRGDVVARSMLVEALRGADPYAAHGWRAAVGEIDVRRHTPDPRVAVPPLHPWTDAPAPQGFAERLYDIVTRWIAMQRRHLYAARRQFESHGQDPHADGWFLQTMRVVAQYETVTLEDCAGATRAIEGREGRVPALIRELTHIRFADEVGPMLSPLQRLRLDQEDDEPNLLLWNFDYRGIDLRLFADAVSRLGVRRPASLVARDYLLGDYLLPTVAWPFFVEHPERLDDCLGLAVPEAPVEDEWLVKALGVLAQMPVMPSRYLPRVVDLSISGPARPRAAARRVVETHGDPLAVATGALSHGRGAIRASAAKWLDEQGATAALPDLRAARAREASAPTRSTITAVVDRLEAAVVPSGSTP
ncbi:hypothetical protein GXP71_12735 [Cellulomonas sp. H30R-01]|uniref:hypothetical protein n=1 Tax=Cellulomonas sp. H30R-01 TaxID=2704467 RepID=UPI00138B4995|nr:hypothetical protein [Cellulomonas sp. H30R-01]QHT56857.1 hypothetical protein GXP71_12735 [Cellulomonas sp. H30R-01]